MALASLVLLAAYIIIFLTVYYMILQAADTNGFQALNQLATSQVVSMIVIVINEFGSELVLVPFALLMYLLSRNSKLKTASMILYAIVAAEVVLTILKAAYYRPRPSTTLLPLGPETDSSFPSGHAARAFTVATITAIIKGRKYAFLLVLALGVAVSRVILGVHYPLDVTAGALLGLMMGIVTYETGRRAYGYIVPRLFPGRSFS